MKDERTTRPKQRFWVGWSIRRERMEWHDGRKGVPPFDVWVDHGGLVFGEWVNLSAVVDACSFKAARRGINLAYGSTIIHRYTRLVAADFVPVSRHDGTPLRTTLPDKPNRYVPVKERKTTK